MHVVFRADGGSQIGYGHLIRSGALADELHTRGHAITVATTTPEPAAAVFPEGATTVELPSRADPEPFVEWLDTATPAVVFTDAYPVDTPYQRAIRDQVPLAVLQDDARHAVCADVFINGNLYGPELDYSYVGPSPETCLGPDYVLLRRAVRERAVADPPWRDQPERAIIILGGSDVGELTPTVVRAFDGYDLHVDAVVGPGCSAAHERAVRSAAADSTAAVAVARDPNDLVDRMARADFAASTASSTTYELLALGTPIVSIPVVDNQTPIATALRTRNTAIVLERDDEEAFRRAIETYVTDSQLRQEYRKRGRTLVDGAGSERIVAKILSLADGER